MMLGFRAWPAQDGLARHCLRRRQYYYIANGFRPRPLLTQAWREVRQVTTEAGDNKSGHIFAGPNEGIFFIDSKLPLINS